MKKLLKNLLIQQAKHISEKSKEAPIPLLPDLSCALVLIVHSLNEIKSDQE